MPKKRYSLAILAAMFGSGWFVADGPGVRLLQQFLAQIVAVQGQPQGGFSPAPGGYPPVAGNYPPATSWGQGGAQPQQQANYQYPNAPAQAAQAPTIPAINAGFRGQAAPAPPTPFEGGPAIHIASFNIQKFGDAKADKRYIMATLAAIVQNFHVVAIQEICTQDDYFIDNFLRTYVNRDGRQYDRVVGPRLGRTTSTEQYAFIYDTAKLEVSRNSVYTLNDPDDLLHREPLIAMFRTRAPPEQAFTFTLVNIHTDPDETGTELDALAQVYQVVRRTGGNEDDVIVLGDLNVDDQHLGALGRVQNMRAVVRGVPTNARQTKQYDNIILHQPSTGEFTGRWGVYDIGRMHNLTPAQVLEVSDHMPIWAEFSAYEAAAPGRVAGRGGEVWTQ